MGDAVTTIAEEVDGPALLSKSVGRFSLGN